MTRVDAIVLAVVGVSALLGLRRGLIGSALSTAGLIAGAVAGARIAPHLFDDTTPYAPVIGLAGAAAGAVILETVGTAIGRLVRGTFALTPLRLVDAVGGLAFGAATGLVLVWVAGAVALHVPGQDELRRGAQRSEVLGALNDIVPPARLMEAIQRVDPFPAIAGPLAPVDPPDPAVLRRPGVRAAAPSVVRVVGNACGLAVSGSGWVARRGLVVTSAHVVAGQSDTTVEAPGDSRLDARVVAFDRRNDVAVLRVPGLRARPLRISEPESGETVAILGYPGGGGFTATAGRIGRTATVFTSDAYGEGPVARPVTSLRGRVRHGNSGGPAVNGRGEVETTVFASREGGGGGDGGFGVPPGPVRDALASARGPVSAGPCAR